MAALICTPALSQETIRVATYHVGLKRDGPGLLLRDILKGDDPQIKAAAQVISASNPDIILLARIDYDFGLQALSAFVRVLADLGVRYPHMFAVAPNTGVATGLDLDGNGYLGDARDAQGYGEFAGQGGMAILSKYPIATENVVDFSQLLWRDMPGATLPETQNRDQIDPTQRLSSVAHWDVPVNLPDGTILRLLAYHATTPVFDGPEDRNGLRNNDETTFWLRYLDGDLSQIPPRETFVILGDANLDPIDGDGRQQSINSLLNSGYVKDTKPRSNYARDASIIQGGANATHRGDPATDTADWRDQNGPGNLRVDYVLPSSDLNVIGSGVNWPSSEHRAAMSNERDDGFVGHGLVWVDITR